jgi:hypothetical protein
MATPPLSASEDSFVRQNQARIDSVIADLAELYRSMNSVSYSSLRNAEDTIIAALRQMGGFSRHIEVHLRALSQQTLDFVYFKLPAPIVDFENEQIPVLLTTAERGRYDGTLASVGYQVATGYSLVDPQQAMRLVGKPLGRFLAAVATPSASSTTPSNVTVSNTAGGWTIVYTPIYVKSENGLGGPSTPVSGYIGPGRYRFGIKQTLTAQWDSTSWRIPPGGPIHVPLP